MQIGDRIPRRDRLWHGITPAWLLTNWRTRPVAGTDPRELRHLMQRCGRGFIGNAPIFG